MHPSPGLPSRLLPSLSLCPLTPFSTLHQVHNAITQLISYVIQPSDFTRILLSAYSCPALNPSVYLHPITPLSSAHLPPPEPHLHSPTLPESHPTLPPHPEHHPAMAASMMTTSLQARVPSMVPSFSGLKCSSGKTSKGAVSAKTCPCTDCKSLVVRAAAQEIGAESATFASVSQSAAPTPTASPSSLFPAIIGAGALGAAAYFVVKQTVIPPAPAKAPPAKSLDSYTFVPPYEAHAKTAAPAALATMSTTFPNAIQEEAFVKAVAAELANLGFKRDNCIALVNTCRDEVCRPIVNLIDREFGLSFNISGLGGLVNCGKTGFGAAMSHSPVFPCDVDGKEKERYIFFAFPHVSVGESGEVGSLLRRGRGKPSSACGALIAIKGDITNGGPVKEDPNDEEYVLLKKKVMAKMDKVEKGGPTLVQTTKAALAAINDDLEKLISLTVDPTKADYAVITGVQIHSGNQIPGQPFRIERTCDYIAPDKMYAVVRGQKYNLQLTKKPDAVAA